MTVARRVKHFIDRLFPRMAVVRRARRSRRGSHRDAVNKGYAALDRRLVASLGMQVASGPFAGMTLTPMTLAEHAGPELLGVYESELHAVLERLLARDYPQIVDVGAKYGYYAVGLSLRQPGAEVIAFDVDPWARRATHSVARANGVTRMQVRGFATPAWFDAQLKPGALVVSDCEGFERELFPAITTPAADSSTFVIEVHEAMAPGVSARLLQRFGATHELVRIPTRREVVLPPELRARLAGFSQSEIATLVDELRGSDQEWLVATPKRELR